MIRCSLPEITIHFTDPWHSNDWPVGTNRDSGDSDIKSCRAVERSENPGVPVLFGGNLPPMVEIGLIDLPKSGGDRAGTPGTPRDDRPVS